MLQAPDVDRPACLRKPDLHPVPSKQRRQLSELLTEIGPLILAYHDRIEPPPGNHALLDLTLPATRRTPILIHHSRGTAIEREPRAGRCLRAARGRRWRFSPRSPPGAAPGLPRNSGGPHRVGLGMSVQTTELGLDGPVGGHLATARDGNRR